MLEDNYQPAQQALVPIVRNQSDAILSLYNKNSSALYNSQSPYTDYGSIGPRQPFVYIKASDSTLSRNLTKYDNQTFPIGSTIRDLNRIGQFSVTGTGLLFYGKQLLLQRQNAFNETRIYNPLSVLKAVAKPGSAGLIDYPQRHLETSGGLVNFFKDALLSSIGFETKDSEKPRIDGTATGVDGVAYSAYAGKLGGARAGLLRYNTAERAASSFDSKWVANTNGGDGSSGGFLANLGKSLVSKLKSFIPSTNPLGAFRGSPGNTWSFRPEYMNSGYTGIFFKFWSDKSGYLSVATRAYPSFYNGTYSANGTVVIKASEFHPYTPAEETTVGRFDDTNANKYASITSIQDDTVGLKGNNIFSKYSDAIKTFESYNPNTMPQLKPSQERFSEVKDYRGTKYGSYQNIPAASGNEKFSNEIARGAGNITIDDRMFSKAPAPGEVIGTEDRYNASGLIDGDRGKVPGALMSERDGNQSKDVIFFYFYDLINNVYIPFRATLSSVSDQHSADWEDITYLGRADRLFLYKGFSRDVSISFTVYANSAKELIPMWTRINYLTGLVRPSKYTGTGVVTRGAEARESYAAQLQSAQQRGDQGAADAFNSQILALDRANEVSGRESSFIYPPMITIRVGDMFVDQPCVISSIGTSIPDDANWESYRSDKNYYYDYSTTKDAIRSDATTRQLPMKVDISLSLKMLEKERAMTGNDLYGFNLALGVG